MDSLSFLSFRVPDSTTSSKIACLCTVMDAIHSADFDKKECHGITFGAIL